MGAKAEWRHFAAIGSIFVGITFTDISPTGPWDDSTFTAGAFGLTGMVLLYLAWFRITFGIKGVVPTMDLWKDPEATSKLVTITGIVILGIAYAIGRIDFFPEPGGLVLSLVGLLVATNGIYVWLSSAGPLREDLASNRDHSDNISNTEANIVEDLEESGNHDSSSVTYNIQNIQNIQIQDSVVVDSKFNFEEE